MTILLAKLGISLRHRVSVKPPYLIITADFIEHRLHTACANLTLTNININLCERLSLNPFDPLSAPCQEQK